MPLPILSRFARRLFDTGKRIDYFWAFLIGAVPVAYSFVAGAAFSRGEGCDKLVGYLESLNFSSFSLLVPLGLFAMRRAAARVMPVLEENLAATVPGVVELFEPDDRPAAYERLRQAVLSPLVAGAAIGADLLINIIDVSSFVPVYWRALTSASPVIPPAYRDWSMMLLIPDAERTGLFASPWAGVPMVVLAYGAQFTIILFPLLFFFAAFEHNRFFLRSIYQRARAGSERDHTIVIDLDDTEKCFGFRTANRSFNAQVTALSFCGCFMLVSRAIVAGRSMFGPCPVAQSNSWFPAAGQWMLLLGWLAALAVVSLPALVKLLPMILKRSLEHVSVVDYLREFLPSTLKGQPAKPEVDYVASKFAENSFWPTGNNRASRLFFFAFFVGGIILAPFSLELMLRGRIEGFVWFAGIVGGAELVTLAAFWGFRKLLFGVDERLVNPPASPLPVPESLVAAKRNLEIAELQIELSGAASPYAVSFEWSLPGSNSTRTVLGRAQIPVDELRTILAAEEYGRRLGAAFFADRKLSDAWAGINAATQANSVKLRVRLLIAPDAVALHAVRWETLRDAEGIELFRGSGRWLSRFLTSDDDKPVPDRPRDQLRALVVIANPKQLALRREGIEPIPVQEEEERARTFFKGICESGPEILGSGGSATLAGITQRLHGGIDIVYLVCHGSVREGVPRLMLEKEDGSIDFAEAAALVQTVRDVDTPPGLVVLASCQSAGSGASADALVALGPQLAAAGVPAVVAMQGKVGMETVAAFMPRFFAELREHGRADEAMAVARGQIARKFEDYWMPVLFMRSKNGALWGEG